MWSLYFLTKRPQFVCIKTGDYKYRSSILTGKTGVSLGTVSMQMLFSFYTYDGISMSSNISIIKYDISIQVRVTSHDNLENYLLYI